MKMATLSMALACIMLGGCDPTPGGGTTSPEFSAINLADLPIKIDWQIPPDNACPTPKPDDIGCTTLCKPCRTWICRDGEWVANDISTPDFICDRPDIPEGPDPTACPRSPEGFCPAECSFCY